MEGEIPFAKRVPENTLETWRKHGIVPRGAIREIMELMHRSHMGVDHIDKKRRELGMDKARERILMDMASRREMDAA